VGNRVWGLEPAWRGAEVRVNGGMGGSVERGAREGIEGARERAWCGGSDGIGAGRRRGREGGWWMAGRLGWGWWGDV